MTNNIKAKIEKEIERLLNELEGFNPDQKEYEGTVKAINDLYAVINKENATEIEWGKIEIENRDRIIQEDTLKDSKIWNAAKIGAEVVGVMAPLVFYGIWMRRGLQFEEEGSFTSTTFKGLIGKFKPTK